MKIINIATEFWEERKYRLEEEINLVVTHSQGQTRAGKLLLKLLKTALELVDVVFLHGKEVDGLIKQAVERNSNGRSREVDRQG